MCDGYRELRVAYVNTRKRRVCEWCGELIEAADRCFSRTYIYDGDFRRGYMHLECEAAMDKAPHDVLCQGWSPGDFKRGTFTEVYQ